MVSSRSPWLLMYKKMLQVQVTFNYYLRVKVKFKVTEELACMNSLYGTTLGKNIF